MDHLAAVHEDLDAIHPVGIAKFLEDPIRDYASEKFLRTVIMHVGPALERVRIMRDLLLDLSNHLASKGIVEGDGINSMRNFTPEEPDWVFIIYEYVQELQAPLHDTFTPCRSLQLTFRDKEASVAKAK